MAEVTKLVRRMKPEELTEVARGLVTDKLIIADPDNPAWRTSLSLVAEPLSHYRNLGLVVVPVGPHVGMYWVNGVAPGVTLECRAVAKGDVKPLQRECDRMRAALFPEVQDGA